MDILTMLFPFSFQAKPDVTALVINIAIYVVVAFIIGIILAIVKKIPIVGLIPKIICSLVELYAVVGIVLSVLDYMKVLK